MLGQRHYDVQLMGGMALHRGMIAEMRTGEGKTLTFPWDKGLTADNALAYYDEIGWSDFTHKLTGAKVVKAQHPDWETYSQGVHAREGVQCADCHMPYMREGSVKVSDHWVRSPLTNINNACQTVRRPPEFYAHMMEDERALDGGLPDPVRSLVSQPPTSAKLSTVGATSLPVSIMPGPLFAQAL